MPLRYQLIPYQLFTEIAKYHIINPQPIPDIGIPVPPGTLLMLILSLRARQLTADILKVDWAEFSTYS